MRRAIIIVLFATLFVLTNGKYVAAHSAWAVIDADTGRLLMGENENVRLPIASLTKIWTAFTVLESGAPLGTTMISPEAASAEGSSIYLQPGVKADVEGLLYGLMLRSGNDAAYALAEHAGGSIEGFSDLMNETALYFGFKDTVFKNPSGLHDEEHLSTAYETARMLYFAMQNKKFKEIASAPSYKYEMDGEVYHWQNKHRMIHSDSDVVAGKTGFTKVAGRTLATYFEKENKKVIVVTLNNGNDWQEHRALSAQVFSTYEWTTVAKKGVYQILPDLQGELKEPIQLLLKKGEQKELSHLVNIPRGEEKKRTGHWTVYFQNKPLVTNEIFLRQ